MSFLTSHRLHWGAHDALHGHFATHLDLHVHDLPRHAGPPGANHAADRRPDPRSPDVRRAPSPEDRLPDIPGP